MPSGSFSVGATWKELIDDGANFGQQRGMVVYSVSRATIFSKDHYEIKFKRKSVRQTHVFE